MAIVYGRSRSGQDDGAPEKRSTAKLTDFPWMLLLIAAVPVGILWCYLTYLAPPRLPGLAGAQVSIQAATQFFVDVSRWCDKYPIEATLIALGFLVGGFILPVSPGKYYLVLTIVATLTLGFSYYCLSVPVDRLLEGIQAPEQKAPGKAPGPVKAPRKR